MFGRKSGWRRSARKFKRMEYVGGRRARIAVRRILQEGRQAKREGLDLWVF